MPEHSEILLSTAYLPNIHYFSKLLGDGNVYIETQDNYQKQTYRNRTVILSANGPLSLVIPVIRPNGNNTKSREIIIDHDAPWQQIHWKAIVSAYNHSPFFDIFEPEIFPVFQKKEKYLLDWNFFVLDLICNISGIELSYLKTITYKHNTDNNFLDYRELIHPKKDTKKNDPDFITEPYYQVFSDRFGFTPNLSFIDLLFNEGADAAFICKKCIKKGNIHIAPEI